MQQSDLRQELEDVFTFAFPESSVVASNKSSQESLDLSRAKEPYTTESLEDALGKLSESSCKRVKSLCLDHNELAALPSNLSRLVMLRILAVAHNRLRSVQTDILSKLPNLTSLNLSDNQIESLPADLSTSVAGLTRLNVSRNRIRVVPLDVAFLKG